MCMRNCQNKHLLHILFNVKLLPLRSFVPVFTLSFGTGEPGIGDGGNEPVGEETYFFFPLKRRINFFALSIVFIKCFLFNEVIVLLIKIFTLHEYCFR